MNVIVTALRTVSALNVREHYMQRSKRVKAEREATAWALKYVKVKPSLPCVVTLTRSAPGGGLDDDNLPGALKGVRDEVAAWLGVDDRNPAIEWRYAQCRGPYSVEIDAT